MLRSYRSIRGDTGLAKPAVLAGVLGVLALIATGSLVLQGSSARPLGGSAEPEPSVAPVVAVLAGEGSNSVPWQSHLTFRVTDGTITSLTATTKSGTDVRGILTPTTWVSRSTLVPSATYLLHAELKDTKGATSTVDKTVTAAAATAVLHATISPSGGTYGVGQPVIVTFDKQIKGTAARTAVLARLSVTSTPNQPGAWRWYDSSEVHYRGPAYWKAGTKIQVSDTLGGLHVPGTDYWGDTVAHSASFRIGRAFIATVDITAHLMHVTIDGALVRTVKVSTGRDKYPTKGGVHIVLTREKSHTYDSSTVGIPTAGPDGYYEMLPYSDRISNGGAFVHANPATTGVQGIRNVSHGCVNTSVADAKWFYENSHLGDIVNIIHSVAEPVRADPGMYEWNYPYAEWAKGNLDG